MDSIIFDLETQYLFQDLGMDNTNRDPSKLKIAVAGILKDGEYHLFEEKNVKELISMLKKAEKIIGHNIVDFDFKVLSAYCNKETIEELNKKAIDTLAILYKLTGKKLALDHLATKNIGAKKTVESIKIPSMWRNGQKDEVKEYLKNDLKITKDLFDFGRVNKKLRYDLIDYGTNLGEKEINVGW
jgi:DEAD/DEAH box helicase domain-containing protein